MSSLETEVRESVNENISSKSHEEGSNVEVVQIPEEYICPITRALMEDPVQAADGFTYEREAIDRWIREGHYSSPMTGARLADGSLITNHTFKALILKFKTQLPKRQRENQIRRDYELAMRLTEEG